MVLCLPQLRGYGSVRSSAGQTSCMLQHPSVVLQSADIRAAAAQRLSSMRPAVTAGRLWIPVVMQQPMQHMLWLQRRACVTAQHPRQRIGCMPPTTQTEVITRRQDPTECPLYLMLAGGCSSRMQWATLPRASEPCSKACLGVGSDGRDSLLQQLLRYKDHQKITQV